MIPISLVVPQKLSAALVQDNALQKYVDALAALNNIVVPEITPAQIVLSSASVEIADLNVQMTYPRVCLYSAVMKNPLRQKFVSFSGDVDVVADVWASDNLVSKTETSIHFYVEGVTGIIRQKIGDWGDGVFFGGRYGAQLMPPKLGGLGFVQGARVTFSFQVDRQ